MEDETRAARPPEMESLGRAGFSVSELSRVLLGMRARLGVNRICGIDAHTGAKSGWVTFRPTRRLHRGASIGSHPPSGADVRARGQKCRRVPFHDATPLGQHVG